MKLRLAHLLPTLPRYDNSFKSGPYKNGNYKGVIVTIPAFPILERYDLNILSNEFLERPWYVKRITPICLSAYGSHTNIGLNIELDKEDNNYDR